MTKIEKVIAEKQRNEADEHQGRLAGPTLTRRALLAGTGHIALLAVMPFGCAPGPGKPFADGTFWDDSTGWTT